MAAPTLHPPTGRLNAWLRPTWIDSRRGLVDPSGINPTSFDSTDVVAAAGDLILTEALLARYLLVVEWLAGTRLLPRDVVALRMAALDRFDGEPETMLEHLRAADRLIADIGALKPDARARRRLDLRLAVTARARHNTEREPVVDCLQRLDPVVAITRRGFVVTEEARTTWRLRRQLVAHVAGLELRTVGRADVPTAAEISRWRPARQHDLARSPVHFITVRTMLRRLDPDGRRAIATVLARTVRGPQSLEVATAALTEVRPTTDVATTIRSRLADLRSPGRS